MTKINFAQKQAKEDKLRQILERLEELKNDFADVVDEYEDSNAKMNVLDLLGESLAAVDDAIDGINDVLMD